MSEEKWTVPEDVLEHVMEDVRKQKGYAVPGYAVLWVLESYLRLIATPKETGNE